ncbi:hypothetical protein WAI453_006624 [Rhynchosporium graminicola]
MVVTSMPNGSHGSLCKEIRRPYSQELAKHISTMVIWTYQDSGSLTFIRVQTSLLTCGRLPLLLGIQIRCVLNDKRVRRRGSE